LKKYRGLIILAVMVLTIAFFCGILPNLQTAIGIPKAAPPVIQLPGEHVSADPIRGLDFPGEVYDVYITNTLIATWITYGILILLALLARAGMKEVPTGLGNFFEMAVEALYNIAEGVVGSTWARRIFPLVATTFLLILMANWLEMIPGVDSVGIMHHAPAGETGYPIKQLGSSSVYYLDTSRELVGAEHTEGEEEHAEEAAADEEHAEEEAAGEEHAEEDGLNTEEAYVVTPFVRPAATDINFPLGLAVVTFIAIQAIGIAALGAGYGAKFINVPALGRGGMGFMDFAVGLLELILEPVKMVSLTFRLLGNIFGGAVLLIVLSTLAPQTAFLLPTGLYLYEMFVGAIQAYVFFMLTLVYASVAMAGHGGDEHH
jgi:F-type H+-transporting ATPase subunit a